MFTLQQTNKISFAKILKPANISANGFELIQIPAFGDGNCAFGAFALGLLDIIKKSTISATIR